MLKQLNQLKAQLAIACFTLVVGAGLIIAGFIVPPLGVIDNSVLVAYGETLTFAGALIGVDYTYRFKEKVHTFIANKNGNV